MRMFALLVSRHQVLRSAGSSLCGRVTGRGLIRSQHHQSRALCTTTAPLSLPALLPLLSEGIVVLKNPFRNKEIILVGTVHYEEKSAELVRKTIQVMRPDMVMIELDASRVDPTDVAQFLLPQATEAIVQNGLNGPLSLPDVRVGVLVKVLQCCLNALGYIIGQDDSLTEEMTTAIEEAHKIQARVLLGDMDINSMLKLLAAALWKTGLVKTWRTIFDSEEISEEERNHIGGMVSKEFCESNGELMDSLVRIDRMRTRLPLLFDAFVTKRDEYMSKAIQEADCRRLVGVVGFGHLKGMTACLVKGGCELLVTPPYSDIKEDSKKVT